MKRTIQNKLFSLTVDEKGRIKGLFNKATNTELITHPVASVGWRLVIVTGRHTRDFVYCADQKNVKITSDNDSEIILSYKDMHGKKKYNLKARFVISMQETEIHFRADIENDSNNMVEEVEFPIIAGIGALNNLVSGVDTGMFYGDVLNNGFPYRGAESDHYARLNETIMFQTWDQYRSAIGSVWADLYTDRQGIYFGYHSVNESKYVIKFEKSPKENPNKPHHFYPKGTPRYLIITGVYPAQIKPKTKWNSLDTIVMPHKGDWHAGVDRFSFFRHETVKMAKPPAWTKDFVGWSEIVGKLYTGEVFHDYKHCADEVIKDSKITGLNFVFYYGHTKIGAEGADFDQMPSSDLGGEKGFRDMIKRLHKNNCRVMLLDHMHRWINKDIPQYKKYGLKKYAILDENGKMIIARWWKDTALSCLDFKGPTPEWVEICPSCKGWLEHYWKQVEKIIKLGVDGLELDTFNPSKRCFNKKHNHALGDDTFPMKVEFMREIRKRIKALNPEFIIVGEAMTPENMEVLDGMYPFRYFDDNGRIYRYLFPEFRIQAVLAGTYSYDAVNKAISYGIGVETEVLGLRKITATACPELAKYIGEVNCFKRKYSEIMIRGTFRDTVGARVKGNVQYSVLIANSGKALVIRNDSRENAECTAEFEDAEKGNLILWKPFAGEKKISKLPVKVRLKPYEASVILDR